MEKVNLKNIIKSFFLGIFIGFVLQFNNDADTLVSNRILILLASGSIGFIIGFITEFATSILPISIAKPRVYFFISNLISLVVTGLIIVFSMIISDGIENKKEFLPMACIILCIVFAANIVDYVIYQRTQNRLKKYKDLLNDK